MRAQGFHIGITSTSLMLMLLLQSSLGFTGLHPRHISSAALVEQSLKSTAIFNSAEPMAPGEVTIEGKNGKTIAVGSIVRVAVSNLKAYQVPPDGRGAFNEDKEFEPAPENAPRASQNLVLPVGMRGVVTKITGKTASLSANFPIQVKFTPGENTDEGYDAPTTFIMHFGVNEVEGV